MGGKSSRDKTVAHERATSRERDNQPSTSNASVTPPSRGTTKGSRFHSGSEASRGTTTPSPAKGPCRYFLSGYCRRGADCEYLHDESGVQPNPPLPAPPAAAATSSAATPTTPNQRSPNKQHTIRTEEQALLLAMLNSLKDSLEAAKTSSERSAIYKDMRKAAAQYKQEQHRIREERQRARGERSLRNQSFGQQSPGQGQADQRVSPLRHVNFPTFPYCGIRFDKHREEGSEDRVECAICLCPYEESEEILVLPCLHWFHAKCAQQWMEKSTECPLCQHDILASLRESQ